MEEPSETCRASVKINKLKKRCILLAVIWNYITMHGHMNIKRNFSTCHYDETLKAIEICVGGDREFSFFH